jgi:hypothetical protein
VKRFPGFALGNILTVALVVLALCGCERQEKVLEVKTPNRHIQVERSPDTSAEVPRPEPQDKKLVDVQTPNTKVEVERSKDRVLPKVDVRTNK